jgi:hypothetical protein
MAMGGGDGAGWKAALLSVWIVGVHVWYFLQFKSELMAALRPMVGRLWR